MEGVEHARSGPFGCDGVCDSRVSWDTSASEGVQM